MLVTGSEVVVLVDGAGIVSLAFPGTDPGIVGASLTTSSSFLLSSIFAACHDLSPFSRGKSTSSLLIR